MTKMTLTQRIIRYLETHNYEEVPGTGKYRKFRFKNWKSEFLFIGKKGAVRKGKTASGSLSLTYGMKKLVNKWEKLEGLQ